MHYYNEIDPYCCAWLDSLMLEGIIPHGVIDHRSIVDVSASDLRGFTSCHFFAGLGGWALALRMAGWPDDRPIWSGSCPCQPFSVAGRRKGAKDERHLFPVFYDLIRKLPPPVVIGEQVASPDGLEWLAGVRTDLEAARYAVGAADYAAAGVGAPHIRQRLYWVAKRLRTAGGPRVEHPAGAGWGRPGRAGEALSRNGAPQPAGRSRGSDGILTSERMDNAARELGDGRGQARRWDGEPADAGGRRGGMGDARGARLPLPEPEDLRGARRQEEGRTALQPSGASCGVAESRGRTAQRWGGSPDVACAAGTVESEGRERERGGTAAGGDREGGCGLSDADGERLGERAQRNGEPQPGTAAQDRHDAVGSRAYGEDIGERDFWRDGVWIDGPDGKWRRVKPGVCLISHGVPARVPKLRALGNAIVPQAAERFIRAFTATQC